MLGPKTMLAVLMVLAAFMGGVCLSIGDAGTALAGCRMTDPSCSNII